MKVYSLKIRVCAAVAGMGLSAFTSAPAGTIGETNIDWNSWQEVAGLPEARYGMAAETLNNALYAFGGINNGDKTNVYRFNGTNWTEVASLPAPRSFMAACVLSGALYSVGGSYGSAQTNVYRFDGTNWTETNSLPAARSGLAGGVLNGALYVVGGWSGGVAQSNVYQFDGTNWTETNSLPARRADLAAGVLNGALYAVGGYDGGVRTNVYRFDGTNWTETNSLPAARSGLAAGVLNGALYAVAGFTGGGRATNVYRFNGTNWTEVAGLPAGRSDLAGGVLNGALYAIGGYEDIWKTNVYRYPALIPYSGVSPSSGSVTGGYQVTITGTNLCNGTMPDVTAVTLCGVAAVAQSVAGSTQIVVTAGASPGVSLGAVRVYSTSQGESVGSNKFTYIGPVMTALGTNGAAIASGASASSVLGTDFGTFTIGSAPMTNTFSVTNSGNQTLNISGVTTAGMQNAEFRMQNVPTTVAVGTASNFAIVFNPSAAGVATASVAIANNSGTTPYMVNLRGVVESVPTANGWLAIQVTPAGGTWQLTAPAGYTGPTSGTGNLAAVTAVTGAYGIAWGALTGYVAPSDQTQFVTGGSTTLFAGVYLQISTNIGTPSVSASEGTYTNKIRVTWQGVAGATGYEIWRSQTNDANTAGRIADIPLITLRRIADDLNGRAQQPVAPFLRMTDGQAVRPYLDGNTYTYDDYAISPILSYYYWVRAKTGTLISPMSYVSMGYAALSPEQATGTADIAVSDMVYLPVNVTNLSCAGTVSCRLANLGPDALNAAGVKFDFKMGTNAAAMIWIGSAQSNMTLAVGQEQLIILPPSAKRSLTVRGDLSGVQQVKVTVRHLSALNDPNLANNTTNAAGSVRIKTSGVNSPGRSLNDYDGDGKSDVAVYGNSRYKWYVALSGVRYSSWLDVETGLAGWTPVPGDYDGDGITDMALYERSSGHWLARFSSGGLVRECRLGGPQFTAAQGDYDGDTLTDPGVYREADGYWMEGASSRQYALGFASLGETGYQPVVADYDGDRLADPAVYNRTTGFWSIGLSSARYQLMNFTFGGSGYLPVSADYDGDGLADPAIYAPGTAYWQVLMSASLATQGVYTWRDAVLVTIGGIPVPADYDGDGRADPTVYHQDTGSWEWYLTTQNYRLIVDAPFGGPTCQPVLE